MGWEGGTEGGGFALRGSTKDPRRHQAKVNDNKYISNHVRQSRDSKLVKNMRHPNPEPRTNPSEFEKDGSCLLSPAAWKNRRKCGREKEDSGIWIAVNS